VPAGTVDERERQRRAGAWQSLSGKIGKRHAHCRLHNFEATSERQRDVLDGVRRYRDELDVRIGRGSNLLIYGPVGTGKDHLMFALLGAAVVNVGAAAEWVSGLDLWGDLRDMIGTDARERNLLRDLCENDVLAISDPSYEDESLKPFYRTFLQRLVDRRYRRMKSTWLTVNVADRQAMQELLGVPAVDRLCEDCLSVHCDWESYRRRKKS